MSFTVTITENKAVTDRDVQEKEVFRQTVELIDLHAVFSAVNKKPRKPRERKPANPAKAAP